MIQEQVSAGSLDLLVEIKDIVRSAIEHGFITSTTLDAFDTHVEELEGPPLENYLQTLWDQL